MAQQITFENTGHVVEPEGEVEESQQFHQMTQREKDLVAFVVEHTDRWRDYRDQNYKDEWERYERIFRRK